MWKTSLSVIRTLLGALAPRVSFRYFVGPSKLLLFTALRPYPMSP